MHSILIHVLDPNYFFCTYLQMNTKSYPDIFIIRNTNWERNLIIREKEYDFCVIKIIHSIRYIGGKREVAVFENHRALGPIIKVIPIGIGKGACIAVLTDPNYEVRFFFCINNHRISGVLFSTKSIPVKRSIFCHDFELRKHTPEHPL